MALATHAHSLGPSWPCSSWDVSAVFPGPPVQAARSTLHTASSVLVGSALAFVSGCRLQHRSSHTHWLCHLLQLDAALRGGLIITPLKVGFTSKPIKWQCRKDGNGVRHRTKGDHGTGQCTTVGRALPCEGFPRQCPALECGHGLLDNGIVLASVVLNGHMREHPESQQTHARVRGGGDDRAL